MRVFVERSRWTMRQMVPSILGVWLTMLIATGAQTVPQGQGHSPALINTCLITANVKGLVRFYESVLQEKAIWSGEDYAEIRTGVGVLAIFSAQAQDRYIPGSAIAANKIAGIRAAMATSELLARYSREHNGANVLTLGATLVNGDEARAIVTTWLTTPMREPRYIRRLARIRDLERI